MSRHTWDTETPWPAPMNETEAAKALSAWEERLRVEREGRDLPPEPGDELESDPLPCCPYCQGVRFSSPFGSESALLTCSGCGEQVHESELIR